MTATHILQISLPAVAITFQLVEAKSEDEGVLSRGTANRFRVLGS